MKTMMLAAICVMAAGIVGCSKDAKDSVNDSTKAIGKDVKAGAEDAGAAMSLTPEIKSAIVANPFLNEDGNVIDVDSTAEAVVLRGHVKSEKNRALAEEIARKILKDKGSKTPLKNELKVQP